MINASPEVAILLCSFNGGRYLAEQLDSISHQTHADWKLYVADDGSTDETLHIVERWGEASPGRLTPVREGPRRGYARNFLSLLAADDVCGDLYAYADQDDIWDSDKLARAVRALANVRRDVPALYCGRTRSVSAAGEPRGLSPLFGRPPGFSNALLQNIAGGNTMVFNQAARTLLREAGAVDVVSHDWWTYLLVTGAGGEVIYDQEPCLSYRQHGANAIGDARGMSARWGRYRSFLRGRNAGWYDRNFSALRSNIALLTDANKETLARFEQARESKLPSRLYALVRSGVYAQTLSGQFGLYAATFLKKI